MKSRKFNKNKIVKKTKDWSLNKYLKSKENTKQNIQKELFHRDMSCQQASRFITNNINSNLNNHKTNHNIINNNNSNCKSNNTIKGNHTNKGTSGGGGGGGIVKLQQQQQQEDPYVFTESVPTTPPILFNTQVN